MPNTPANNLNPKRITLNIVRTTKIADASGTSNQCFNTTVTMWRLTPNTLMVLLLGAVIDLDSAVASLHSYR